MEYVDKFLTFQCVFNEYIRKVAIPKNWEFTKTIKRWPDGTGEGEGISEDGRIWYTTEKRDLLQKVLDYPDLVLFAMENYGVFIDCNMDKPAEEIKTMWDETRAEVDKERRNDE